MRFNEFNYINEGPNDPHIFKAVFMAGSPGSGKSTVANHLFGGTGLRTLNVDQFWKLYQQKNKRGDYDKFWDLYSKKEKPLLRGKIGLLIDGTGKNPEIQQQLKNKLEEEGYDTIMVFVETDEETALRRSQTRASDPLSSDYGRHIDQDFVKTTYNRVLNAKPELAKIFGDNFLVVDNSDKLNVTAIERKVRRWLNTPPSNPIALQWLGQQRNQSLSSNPQSAEPNTDIAR